MFKKLLAVALFGIAGVANAVSCQFSDTLVMAHNGEQVAYQVMSYRNLDAADVEVLKAMNTPFISTLYNQRNKGGKFVFNYQYSVACDGAEVVFGPDIFWTGYKNLGQEKVWNSYFNQAKQKLQYLAN